MTTRGIHMTITELAAADQHDAKIRDQDQAIARVARRFLTVAGLAGAYATLAVFNVVPAMPWSPLG